MNTLAHLALGHPDPQLMLGQYLGDHVKGPVEDAPYSAKVLQGIRDHRRIDAVSDQHEITRYAKSLLPKEHRRMGGIVMDVYADALLADLWNELMDIPLHDFLEDAKQLLLHPREPLPPSAQRYADRLVSYGLLEAYTDAEELPNILDRMGSHLRRPMRLSPLLAILRTKEEAFLTHFASFFPEMKDLLQ